MRIDELSQRGMVKKRDLELRASPPRVGTVERSSHRHECATDIERAIVGLKPHDWVDVVFLAAPKMPRLLDEASPSNTL